MAFYPRKRANSLESRVRNWPDLISERPSLAGFAGFKVGNLNVMTVDDREKTPNFGKNLLNRSTLIATPPIRIIGIRGYKNTVIGKKAVFDFFTRETDKDSRRKAPLANKKGYMESIDAFLNKVNDICAIVSVHPIKAALAQKKPFVWEMPISAKDIKSKLEFAKENLGKEFALKDVFRVGQFIDVSSITRGKGVEGPITRFGVKRKQHKSRKSVRALGTLGPISPAVVMYTVPRQGQRGFHQRTEYNKRILLISGNSKDENINPKGGFNHFGHVTGDYVIVRGSVPGVPKRLVKMRVAIRNIQKKILEPKVIEVVMNK